MKWRHVSLPIAFSSLPAVLIVVLGVRSYRVCDVLLKRDGRGTDGIWICKGWVLHQGYWFHALGFTQRGWHLTSVPVDMAEHFAGTNPFFDPVSFPLWLLLPLLLLGPIAVWAVGKALERHRHRPGRCRACGYDLRATPNRCPECGTVPVGATAAGE